MTEHGLTCDGEDQQDRRPQHRPHRAAHTPSSCPQSVLTVLLRMSSARPLPCVSSPSTVPPATVLLAVHLPFSVSMFAVRSLSSVYTECVRRPSAADSSLTAL